MKSFSMAALPERVPFKGLVVGTYSLDSGIHSTSNG